MTYAIDVTQLTLKKKVAEKRLRLCPINVLATLYLPKWQKVSNGLWDTMCIKKLYWRKLTNGILKYFQSRNSEDIRLDQSFFI